MKLGRDVLCADQGQSCAVDLLSTSGAASDLETSCEMSTTCFTQCLPLRPKTALCLTPKQPVVEAVRIICALMSPQLFNLLFNEEQGIILILGFSILGFFLLSMWFLTLEFLSAGCPATEVVWLTYMMIIVHSSLLWFGSTVVLQPLADCLDTLPLECSPFIRSLRATSCVCIPLSSQFEANF